MILQHKVNVCAQLHYKYVGQLVFPQTCIFLCVVLWSALNKGISEIRVKSHFNLYCKASVFADSGPAAGKN